LTGGLQKDFGSSAAHPIFAHSYDLQAAHPPSFNLSHEVSRGWFVQTNN